ncbi:hypothetical protein GCM10023221_02940 [Luteimicrobium xylanilyticum]
MIPTMIAKSPIPRTPRTGRTVTLLDISVPLVWWVTHVPVRGGRLTSPDTKVDRPTRGRAAA